MKKAYAILLALALTLALAACGGNPDPDPNSGVYEAVTAELAGISVEVSDVFEAASPSS
jgi:ABC-type glycerol-3-phosphate transport system substrate-binding protein